MKNKFLKELSSIIDYSKYNFLLAVSGGVDSMVLAYLFHRLNIKFSIAHCNFCLRDSDSDDEPRYQIPGKQRFVSRREYLRVCGPHFPD